MVPSPPPGRAGKARLIMVLTVKFDVFDFSPKSSGGFRPSVGEGGGRRGRGEAASGEVRVHEGDSAVRLARGFCQRYGLDEAEVALPLAEHIEVGVPFSAPSSFLSSFLFFFLSSLLSSFLSSRSSSPSPCVSVSPLPLSPFLSSSSPLSPPPLPPPHSLPPHSPPPPPR